MINTYVLLRLYEGGGLAESKIVDCDEDELFDICVKFEKDCASENLGTRLAVLDKDEVLNIAKELL